MFLVEIDPREMSIKKVEFNKESVELGDMYSTLECGMVERVALNNVFDLWIDEEGMLNNAIERIGSFNIGEYQFVGKGLICGYDDEGNSVPLKEDFADYLVDELNLNF